MSCGNYVRPHGSHQLGSCGPGPGCRLCRSVMCFSKAIRILLRAYPVEGGMREDIDIVPRQLLRKEVLQRC